MKLPIVLCLLILPLVAAAAPNPTLPVPPAPVQASAVFEGVGDRDSTICMDLVFVVDTTSSMSYGIANVQAGLSGIINQALNVSAGDLRLGLVTFTDSVFVQHPLTTNLGAVQASLLGLSANGGWSDPEASDEALHELATSANCLASGDFLPGDWRAGCCKVAIIVTDARPGGCDDTYQTGVDDISAHQAALGLAALGVRVGAIYLENPEGADPLAVAPLYDYASTTGGVYGQLPNDGTGLALAMEDMILDCVDGSENTELCCLDEVCTTVLQGTCESLGGILVSDCEECGDVATQSTDWTTIKTLY